MGPCEIPADYSKVDNPGPQYKSVNFGAKNAHLGDVGRGDVARARGPLALTLKIFDSRFLEETVGFRRFGRWNLRAKIVDLITLGMSGAATWQERVAHCRSRFWSSSSTFDTSALKLHPSKVAPSSSKIVVSPEVGQRAKCGRFPQPPLGAAI